VETAHWNVKVFTYYKEIPGKSAAEEAALIDLWARSWRLRGWEPVVLGEGDLPDDPEARRLLRASRAQPSVMKPGLAYSWFARWVAVAAKGGGVMSDYDVINYSFAPVEIGVLTVHERHVPCLVSGTRGEFLRLCEVFAAYRADRKDRVGWRKDVSDMKILIRRPEAYLQATNCVEYALDGWERAPAVHYSSFAMKPRGLVPRHEHIPRLRPLE
jgi:hypothetical protein